MLAGRGDTECSLVDPHYEVWELPDQRIPAHFNLFLTGIRLGPKTSEEATNYATSAKRTPPAMREPSIRELMLSFEVQGQVGYPPTMSTDADLGYSPAGNRSAVIAGAKRDAGKLILARLGRTVVEAHTAPKPSPRQRAKSGYCSCCTRATRAAIPPRCEPGEFSRPKERGLKS